MSLTLALTLAMSGDRSRTPSAGTSGRTSPGTTRCRTNPIVGPPPCIVSRCLPTSKAHRGTIVPRRIMGSLHNKHHRTSRHLRPIISQHLRPISSRLRTSSPSISPKLRTTLRMTPLTKPLVPEVMVLPVKQPPLQEDLVAHGMLLHLLLEVLEPLVHLWRSNRRQDRVDLVSGSLTSEECSINLDLEDRINPSSSSSSSSNTRRLSSNSTNRVSVC
mmetsp:Transcript_16126/g.38008  ORF Transcript_16126/g.38008 Transcript_16126/m.38008 type:complete len:217 (-) Transcript_16126:511-1161(-)